MDDVAISVNRFGLGARPGEPLPAQPRRWLLDQFDRYQADSPAWARTSDTLSLVTAQLDRQGEVRAASDEDRNAAQRKLRSDARDAYRAAVDARVTEALDTPAPFVERLVHFWSNHFAISVEKQPVLGLAGAFEREAIRPHVLGRFTDLLSAAVHHPALLIYLDQTRSAGPDSNAARRAASQDPPRQRGLNENLAREIMELHTLGARGGYSQADVTEFARALTGWSVIDAASAQSATGGFLFRPGQHEPGNRTVLGRSYAQRGEAQAAAILQALAQADATARHIAFKLARHFVADDPPADLVDRLARGYRDGGGELTAVYRALIDSPEAWRHRPAKFKSPWEWVISSLRALGRRDPRAGRLVALFEPLGQPVWRPGSPAGYDDVAASWAAPEALMRRVELAQRFAALARDVPDPRVLAPQVLPGGALAVATATAVARAESPSAGLALLLVSPDFLRR